MDARALLVVGVGAALGGMLRFIITQLVIARVGLGLGFYATLAINVTGSFAIGVVAALVQTRPGFSPLLRLFLATGILGGYTTFSTFSLETVGLVNGGSGALAAGYVFGSVALGIAAAFGGLAAGRALAP